MTDRANTPQGGISEIVNDELINQLQAATGPHCVRNAIMVLRLAEPGAYRDELARRCHAALVTGNWDWVTRWLFCEGTDFEEA